jgi:hypothetical protein
MSLTGITKRIRLMELLANSSLNASSAATLQPHGSAYQIDIELNRVAGETQANEIARK